MTSERNAETTAINIDSSSPYASKSDIDRFFALDGASLLTMRTPDNNIPYASIENGIAGEIHIGWEGADQEAFLSVWKGCGAATLVLKRYGEKADTEAANFSLSEDKGVSEIKTKIENFFNYVSD